MRITWVTRSFLDYRIPVYKSLADFEGVDFTLICSGEPHITPQRCIIKAKKVLGERVKILSGEKCFGKPYTPEQRSNTVSRIFWQPGLFKKINASKPDIVITDAFNHWTLPVLGLKFTGAKFKHLMCYERTKHTERNIPNLKRKFIGLVSKYIDAVHCNGILCKDFLLSLGYPESKLQLGNMAADSQGLMNSVAKLNIKDQDLIRKKLEVKKVMYLFVGGLIPRKGIMELLLSWQKSKLSEATLVIAGEGKQRNDLQFEVLKQKIENVVFTGSVNHEEIAYYYNAADCFIMPTLEDNWSLVVPEAMSCGLPVISSIYNGCYPELVKKENGWTFDPLNENSIVEVLKTSYSDNEKFALMGKQSLKIIKDFTPEKIAGKIMDTCVKITSQEKWQI